MPKTKQWMLDAVAATQGNNTRLGAILIRALGQRPPSGRRMFSRAVITPAGYVVANYVDAEGHLHKMQVICTLRELRDNFRTLADKLKLNDADREEMFQYIRDWIAHDNSGLGVDFKKLELEEIS